MTKYANLYDAFGAMEVIGQKRKTVAALLYFRSSSANYPSCGPVYVFESQESPQMEVRKSLAMKTGEGSFMDEKWSSREGRNSFFFAKDIVSGILGNVFEKKGLSPRARHAEEKMIEAFSGALKEQAKKPKYVSIYLTHSPCTTQDENAVAVNSSA